MDGADIARIIRSHLLKVADQIGESTDDPATVKAVQRALRDPWICTMSPSDPGVFRWFNAETGQWGEVCDPN